MMMEEESYNDILKPEPTELMLYCAVSRVDLLAVSHLFQTKVSL
jgi:hypothetical protein